MEKVKNESRHVYEQLCKAAEGLVTNYEANRKEMSVCFEVEAKPFPLKFVVKIDANNDFVNFFVPLMINVPKKNRNSFAREICRINFENMSLGYFSFHPETGRVVLCDDLIYRGSLISEETFETAITCMYDTACRYYEPLLHVSRADIQQGKSYDVT